MATVAAVLGMTFGLMPILNVPAASAANPPACDENAPVTGVKLCVESSTNGSTQLPYAPPIVPTVHKGDAITAFKWLVNQDTTGDPTFNAANVAACLPARAKPTPAELASNPSLADYATAGDGNLTDCPWPSVHSSSGHAPVIASGDEGDLASLGNLPDGKYLISVTASGHKIDGSHFTMLGGNVVSLNGDDVVGGQIAKQLVVKMNPLPKKTATVRIHVFNDNASTNGQWDGQTETLLTCDSPDVTPQQRATNCGGSTSADLIADPATDMAGFSVQITDVLATVTTDVYGNPLCTEYERDANGNIFLNTDGSPNPLAFGDPASALAIPTNGGASGSALAGTESTCLSDHYGDIVIPNMGPNRYAATVIPPDPRAHDGVQWIQTTTLEGGHDWDTWNLEGGTGYDTELIVGGERTTPVVAGFVRLSHSDAEQTGNVSTGWNLKTGTAYNPAAYYNANMPGGTGSITGKMVVGRAYVGSGAGAPLAGTNLANAKEAGNIKDGILSLSCVAGCTAPTDSAIWTGRADGQGNFNVTGLQAGDYVAALWDETQNYILAVLQYTVVAGLPTDMGHVLLPGWFTDIRGTIFNDINGDGIQQPDEPGIPDFTLTIRTRGNSLQDQGAALAKTDDKGTFDLSQGYPLGQFLILEAYNQRFKNTGYTYTTDNDPTPHTVLTPQVDINFLPIIGLSANIKWGMQAYGVSPNGGTAPAVKDANGAIVGTATYDVTRNELNPRQSVQEDYQPGLSGIPMQLWGTKKDANDKPLTEADGSVQQWGYSTGGGECRRAMTDHGTDAVATAAQSCKPYDYYTTESWQRPVGCKALDVNGNLLVGELALPDAPTVVDYSHNPDNLTASATPAQAADCIETPMSSMQVGGNGMVDGNFALTSINMNPAANPTYDHANDPLGAFTPTLPSGAYIVEAVNPLDTINTKTIRDPDQGGYMSLAAGAPKKLYRFTDETAVNIFSGNTYVPQNGFFVANPDHSGGAKAPLTEANQKIRTDLNSLGTGRDSQCAGGLQTITPNTDLGLGAENPDMLAGGGSPYANKQVAVCDAKLVNVVPGRSVNPGFFMYTEVPTPSKFYGLVNDDLNVNVDRRSVLLGEVAPLSNGPVGIYDENGNWKYTAHSDVNGFYEVIVPSMDTYNCPLPAGPCPNVYRLVGNDPGQLAHRNADYNPQFRTIATEFQAWTGVVHPVDQAPTHIGITIEGPAAQYGALSLCAVNDPRTAVSTWTNPVFYSIDKPYFDPAADVAHSYVVKGAGFGAGATVTLTSTGGAATNTGATFTAVEPNMTVGALARALLIVARKPEPWIVYWRAAVSTVGS